ncbi:MAG: MBL fold metallo-hydrolase [Clostridiales bacterium]|jgi:glyoxylase-like metal-dependent hydrolase (beta-lactamase superfamily II)|nr:MBL fold metallo-hydrolase [Clostridiales bacterium]
MAAYEIIKIGEKSWRFEENGVRSFLFEGENAALLVDTGYGSGNIKEAAEGLTKLPIQLVITHADGDHISGNKYFEKARMHPAEFDRFHNGAGKGLTAEALWENEIIDLGGRKFEVILIPGHTPGSIALLDRKNRILVAGDSIQAGMIFMAGGGRNIDAYIFSMKKIAAMADLFDTVYPSHGPFPVNADIMPALITGAQNLKDGKLKGEAPPFETNAKVYDAGAAKFLF